MSLNPLYESLPQTVLIEKKEYPIYTDFREWIRFIELAQDKSVPKEEKPYYYVGWYVNEVPEDTAKAINALSDFLAMSGLMDSEGTKGKSSNKRVLSYKTDAPYILSGFFECYGIDLTKESMHWWMFQMLLMGLREDTEIKQRIAYRSADLSEIKDKNERRRIQKIQRRIALPQDEVTDYEIGNAFL